MDLFRYFHPHHNPRLRSTALRAQEIGELELAALELQRALERARIRTHAADSRLAEVRSSRSREMARWEQLSLPTELAPQHDERDPPGSGRINASHFESLLVAASYLVESLTTLAKAHPGDSDEEIQSLLRERQDAPGWENWARLLSERLKMIA